MSLSLLATCGALLASNHSFGFKALGTGETNTFTLTNSNLVADSIKWDADNYTYTFSIRGTSLHHGDFLSNANDTYAYGNFGTEGCVDFSQPDSILVASSDSYRTAGSASFGFGFTFKGITAVNSCTYTYLEDGEEYTGFAYVDGLHVYDFLSNANGVAELTLVDISISYSC